MSPRNCPYASLTSLFRIRASRLRSREYTKLRAVFRVGRMKFLRNVRLPKLTLRCDRCIVFFETYLLTFAVLLDTKLQNVPGRWEVEGIVAHLFQLRHRVRLIRYYEMSLQYLLRL